jgi:hypothetical protein
MSDTAEPAELAETAPAIASAAPSERPAHVPEKFWNAEEGAVRLDALLKSYLELERKLGAARLDPEPEAAPAGTSADESAPPPAEPPPAPVAPQNYTITSPHPLIEPDPAIDARLLEAGLSQAQAQVVYDLAAERLLPVIEEALGELDAQQQAERLQRHFGGVETWRQTARQIKSWAAANLPPDIHATLAGSYEGVLALHQMMRASEPELLGAGGTPAAELNEETLAEMMRDPRYWRQRDPEFIARVTAGFKRLYAG